METNAMAKIKLIELHHLRRSYWERGMKYWEFLFTHDWKVEAENEAFIEVFHTVDVFPCEERAAFQVRVGKGENIYWCSIPRPCYEILDDICQGVMYYARLEESE